MGNNGLFGFVGDSLFGDQSKNFDDVADTDLSGKYGYAPSAVDAAQTDAAQQDGNALAGLHGDAGGIAAQRAALQRLQETSRGGLNASDRASLFQAQQSTGQQARGAQDAILQGAAARGNLNSGNTLAAQLSAAQAAQEAGAATGAAVAGQSADRALGATQAAGALGGQLDTNETRRQAATGSAQNAINAANTAATNRSREFNAGSTNDTRRFNANQAFDAQKYNSGLSQQDYTNKMQKRGAVASAQAASADRGYGLVKDVARAGGAAYGAYNSGNDGVSDGAWHDDYKPVATTDLAHGGAVPGKAPVKGDSAKNDTVPAMLSPGEVVIPRSALGSPDKLLAFLKQETGMHFSRAVAARKGK